MERVKNNTQNKDCTDLEHQKAFLGSLDCLQFQPHPPFGVAWGVRGCPPGHRRTPPGQTPRPMTESWGAWGCGQQLILHWNQFLKMGEKN